MFLLQTNMARSEALSPLLWMDCCNNVAIDLLPDSLCITWQACMVQLNCIMVPTTIWSQRKSPCSHSAFSECNVALFSLGSLLSALMPLPLALILILVRRIYFAPLHITFSQYLCTFPLCQRHSSFTYFWKLYFYFFHVFVLTLAALGRECSTICMLDECLLRSMPLSQALSS